MKYEIRNYSNYTIDNNKIIRKKSINGSYTTRVKEQENGKGKKYVFLINDSGERKRCFVDRIYLVATGTPISRRESTRKYSNELLLEIVEYKKNHTWKEVEAKYNVNWRSIKARIASRYNEIQVKPKDERKKHLRITARTLQEVIEYKINHTWKEVEAKFCISKTTLYHRIVEYEANQKINFFRSLRVKKKGTVRKIEKTATSVIISVETIYGVLKKEVSESFYITCMNEVSTGSIVKYTLQSYYASAEDEENEVLSFRINELSL